MSADISAETTAAGSRSGRSLAATNPDLPSGPLTHRPLIAVASLAGISQYASKPRKWSMRTMSTISKVRRMRSIHQR